MKTIRFLMMALMAICLASCGGKKNDDTFDVTVDNTTIGGKLSNYFSLEDKTYKYKLGMIDKINVELRCIEPLPENLKAYIAVEVLNENGVVISSRKPDAWSFNDYDLLRQATPGQIVAVSLENYENVRDDKPAKIRLSSIIEEDPENGNSYLDNNDDYSDSDDEDDYLDNDDEDESDTEYSSTSGSTDWDQLLDEYEKFVNSYVSLMNKANNGNASALTECMEMMEKVESLSEKLDDAEDDMSTAQMNRFVKIQTKFAGAATKLSGSSNNVMDDLEDVEDAVNSLLKGLDW